ncbi:MAG: N-acyl homoserine lactonase family protein [Enterocloster citroniae]|nr:N-acyl homoserine lactonase family protein [Enterocloster citroniae]
MRIHIFHTGEVHVSPYLPFGGDDCGIMKASGVTTPKKEWLWLPVSAYLIEHPKGRILVDTGWHREMSPEGVYDRKAQIKSLGSFILFNINQGRIARGEAIDEQLASLGLKPADIDYVLLTHLDCDHANGLTQVKGAKRILVAADELSPKNTKKGFVERIRYQKRWWEKMNLETFDWNGSEGPVGKSFDLFGDGSVVMVNIPGHSSGLCAVKVKNKEGQFVLLFSDGGYARKSWEQMITSGVCQDKKLQRQSLQWIREQSQSSDCIESLANHDPDVKPHIIDLS